MNKRDIERLINLLPEKSREQVSRKVYDRINYERKKMPGAFMNLPKERYNKIMEESYNEVMEEKK